MLSKKEILKKIIGKSAFITNFPDQTHIQIHKAESRHNRTYHTIDEVGTDLFKVTEYINGRSGSKPIKMSYFGIDMVSYIDGSLLL